MVKKYGDLYLDTRRALMATEDAQTAGMMAKEIICHVTGKSTEFILANRDLYVSDEVIREVEKLQARLLAGEPLAYVLGHWEFYGLPLKVTPDVLIPRDDTCAVASLAINQALFLSQDPRPGYQQDPERIYGFPYGNMEIRFSVREDILTVCQVETEK